MNAVTATGDQATSPIAGTTGKSRLADAFQINLEGIEGVKLEYSVHNRIDGWSKWTSEGQIAGYVQPDDQLKEKDILKWKQAEAIKISVVEGLDKLKAAGYEIRYRVHLGYDGWEKEWTVADDSKAVINKKTENSQTGKDANGNKVIAGSVGWSRRIEALQVMLVKTRTINDAKAEAVEKLEKYKDFMSDEENSAYKGEATAIEKAISDVNKAETEAEIQEIVDKAIEGVSPEAKKAMEQLDEAKEEALADLQKYLDAGKGLGSEDKARLESLVAEASKQVEATNSEDGVTTAVGTFKGLMKASETLGAVALQKAKDDMISALEECRDASKPALNNLIDKTIEDVNEMDSVDAIEELMEQLLNNPEEGEEGTLGSIIKLKNAQKEAYEKLKAYEDYLATNTTLPESDKRAILNEINTVKELIDNAESDKSINNSSDPKGAMDKFEEFMNEPKYKVTNDAVKLEVAKKELATKYQEYLAELAPYLASSDENTKKIAEKAAESMKKIAEPEEAYTSAEDITQASTGALDKLKALYEGNEAGSTPSEPEEDQPYKLEDIENDSEETFVGYEKILKYNDELAKRLDKEDKEAREAEYKKAIEVLDLYETVLKDSTAIGELGLSNSDVTNIQNMLDATRSSVTKATGAKAIKDAMNLLRDATTKENGFLDKYYPEYAEYASNYEFEHAQTAALNKLKEYAETYADVEELTGKSGIITSAIKDIEGYQAEKNTAAQVNDVLENTVAEIEKYEKQQLIDAEKARLKKKYQEIIDIKDDDGIYSSAKAFAQQAIVAVNGVEDLSTAEEYEAKMKELKDIEEQYDEELKVDLDRIAKDKEDDRKVEVARVNPIIDAYIDIAKASGRNAVVTALTDYKNLVSKAEDADAVKAVEAEMNGYIEKSCKTIKQQYEAITKLNKIYDTYVKDATFKPYLEKIKAIIDDGNADIKAIKLDDWNDVDGENGIVNKIKAIVEFNSEQLKEVSEATVNTKIKAITDAKTALDSKKITATGAIDTAIGTYNSSLENELKNYVQDFKDQINAITEDDEDGTKINKIKEDALKSLESYVKAGITNNAKDTTVPEEATQIAGEKTALQIQEGVTIKKSGSVGVDFDVEGKLIKVDTDWTDLSTISTQTGYFVCLKINAKYAGKVEAKFNNATDDVEVKDQADGSKLVLVRVSDVGVFAAPTGKKLEIKYWDTTAGSGAETAKVVYSLDKLTEQAG